MRIPALEVRPFVRMIEDVCSKLNAFNFHEQTSRLVFSGYSKGLQMGLSSKFRLPVRLHFYTDLGPRAAAEPCFR